MLLKIAISVGENWALLVWDQSRGYKNLHPCLAEEWVSAGGSDGGGDTGWRKGSDAGVEKQAGLQTGWTDCKAQGLRPDFGAGHQDRWEGREGPRTLVERMGEEEVDCGGRRADHQLPGPWNEVTGQWWREAPNTGPPGSENRSGDADCCGAGPTPHRFPRALHLRPGCRQGQSGVRMSRSNREEWSKRLWVHSACRPVSRRSHTPSLHLAQDHVQAGAQPGGLSVLEALMITRLCCGVPWGPRGCGWKDEGPGPQPGSTRSRGRPLGVCPRYPPCPVPSDQCGLRVSVRENSATSGLIWICDKWRSRRQSGWSPGRLFSDLILISGLSLPVGDGGEDLSSPFMMMLSFPPKCEGTVEHTVLLCQSKKWKLIPDGLI